jgi:hypothetical protein
MTKTKSIELCELYSSISISSDEVPNYAAFVRALDSHWKQLNQELGYSEKIDLALNYRDEVLPKLSPALGELEKHGIEFDRVLPRLASGLAAAHLSGMGFSRKYLEVLKEHSPSYLMSFGGRTGSNLWSEDRPGLDGLVIQAVFRWGFARFFESKPEALFELAKLTQKQDLTDRFCGKN